MKVLSVCAFAALAASAVLGADVSWTGGAGDHKWSTGGNWSTGSRPGDADVAVFAKANLPSGSTVVIDQDETIKALRFGDDVQDVVFDGRRQEGGFYSLTLANGGITGASNKKTSASFACNVYLAKSASVRSEYAGIMRFYGAVGSSVSAADIVNVSFDGTQNGNVYSIGTLSGNCRFLVKGNTFKLGEADASGYSGLAAGGRIASAASVDIDSSEIASAHNYNSTLRLENIAGATSQDRIADDVLIRSVGNGGQLAFAGVPDGSVIETIGEIALEAPLTIRFGEKGSDSTDGANTTLSVNKVTVASAGFLGVKYAGTGNALYMPGMSNDAGGILGPWALEEGDNSQFLTVDASTRQVTPLAYSSYAALASAGATEVAKVLQNESVDLVGSKEVWALYMYKTSTVNIGDGDLSLGSGGIVMCQGGNKAITSSGGALAFGGNALYVSSQKSGLVEISAPIKWNKPAAGAQEHPDLVIRKANNSGPDAWFALDGEDLVGDWGDVYFCAITNSNKLAGIELGGPSDRRIHGRMAGLGVLTKSGSGALSFEDGFVLNARNITGVVKEGKVVANGASAKLPVFTVQAGGSFEVAEGSVCSSGATVMSGGRLMGLGRFSSTFNAAAMKSGAILRGGSDTKAGTLTVGGAVTFGGDFSLEIPVDAEGVGKVVVPGNLTLPTAAATVTVKVNAVADQVVRVRTADSVPVLTCSGTLANSGVAHVWSVVTDTPKRIDVSNATVVLEGSSYVIKGMRSVNGGFVIILR